MTTAAKPATPPKWYHEPIVWLILALLGSVVIASMVTIALAINSDDGLVNDNYYRDGLAINTALTASDNAVQLRLEATLDAEPNLLIVRVHSANRIDVPLRLQFAHPTNARLDVAVSLNPATASHSLGEAIGAAPANNTYTWQLNPRQLGLHTQWDSHRWLVALTMAAGDKPWRIQGVLPPCCDQLAVLRPY